MPAKPKKAAKLTKAVKKTAILKKPIKKPAKSVKAPKNAKVSNTKPVKASKAVVAKKIQAAKNTRSSGKGLKDVKEKASPKSTIPVKVSPKVATKSKKEEKKPIKKDIKKEKEKDVKKGKGRDAKKVEPKQDPKKGSKDTKGTKAAKDSKVAKDTKDVKDVKDTKDGDKKEEKIVTGIRKGKAVVDKSVPNGNLYHVYEEAGMPYHCSLMWTDLRNNNNKFYIIQLLQMDANMNTYLVFNKWGRVGVDGQFASFLSYNVNDAKNTYEKKVREKTSKGYTEIKISFEDEDNSDKGKNKEAGETKVQVKSKLDSRVQSLIMLIFNMDLMKQQMAEIGYDAKKMPLGKLSKETIKQGYEWLKKISDVLDKKAKGDLMDLSGRFYTVIPHDFGFQHMTNFVINNQEKLKNKLEMVQSLGDIEIATRLLEGKSDSSISEVDNNYSKLKCKISAVEKNSEDYTTVMEYITNTHGDTHYFKLDLQDLYKVDREGEDKKFNSSIGNNLLLWHGSRLTNYVGILSQGLRIAPPEAPVSGYMFGKGIYFADMVSKSANYCSASSSNNVALMLLVKVAVGKPRPLYNSDFNASTLPAGCHSTKGLGRTAPPESQYKKFRGMLVPCSKGEKVSDPNCYLMYNEFIVYDTAQAKLEYLLKVKVN